MAVLGFIFGAERGLVPRYRPKRPGTERPFGLPSEVPRLYELVAVFVVRFFAGGVFLLRQAESALHPRDFEAVLGFSDVPRAKGSSR